MNLSIRSLINWKLLLPALLLAGGLAFFLSHDVVYAQTDCVDPATGAACTPVPPPPSCGVAGAPPCDPPPPSGCTAADPCTPVPPPPSQSEPTNTPRPRPTKPPTSTATFTATPTEMAAVAPTSTSTALEIPAGTATTAPDFAPAPNVPKPNLVTPKSQQGIWGRLVNWVKLKLIDSPLEKYIDPFVMLDDVLVLQGDNCVQGCGPTTGWVIAGKPVNVYVKGSAYGWTIVDSNKMVFAACQGETYLSGCANPLPNMKYSSFPFAFPYPSNFVNSPYYKGWDPSQNINIAHFVIPGDWIPSTGLYGITLYVNYNQQAAPEYDMSNNTKTVFLNANKPQQLPTPVPTPTVSTSTDPYSFYDTVVALQDGKCVQGCSATPNDLVVGQPVDVYLRFKYSPNNDGVDQYVQPGSSALFACQGQSGQNGCSYPLQENASPNVPQWFYNSPYGYLLQTQYNIAHFTIPGNWIPSEGTSDVTFFVNYAQQAAPEMVMNNNLKTVSLDAVTVIPTPTPSPTPALMPLNDPFSFYDTVVVLQNGSCVQGCTLPHGDVTAGQPVDVYLRYKYTPFNDGIEHYSPPSGSGLVACLGDVGQAGCSSPFQVDSSSIPPQWFVNSPYANLLQTQYSIAHFTIPGNWIPSMGVYGVTFFVNYQNQVLPMPEQNTSNNVKTIYLSAIAP